ncbi:Na+:solute symporter [Lentisphaerota bacterium ZTH]|nr:Na+:solute symporter [Lentisphaerota bacterium]WET05391.1 Na+:solute symporter [Lentisphaerota bacterium ZTH]
MHWIDWLIVAGYVLAAVAIGFLFKKQANQSTDDFFVAGRTLSWFIAGTSIVATTFASDTPLFVAAISRSEGIFSNWLMWGTAIGHIGGVFFFARLWRRTHAVTEIEFIKVRYGENPTAKALRIFKVFTDGVMLNCVTMAAVTLAMGKVISSLLSLPSKPIMTLNLGITAFDVTYITVIMLVLGGAAVLYSTLSGLYGVVYTDLMQFCLAMLGAVILAAIVYTDAGGFTDGMLNRLSTAPGYKKELLGFMPPFKDIGFQELTFFTCVGFFWWGKIPGSGYMVQRMLSTKNERHSLLALLWYVFTNYVLRVWPWILVGVFSLIYFPFLEDSDTAYPRMIGLFLPTGLKGIMVASLLAAFMSTVDTQLNWGASYLINDFYMPYLGGNKRSQKGALLVSKLAMLLLVAVAVVISTFVDQVVDVYKFVGIFFTAMATYSIARWYWWRASADTEIVALASSIIICALSYIFMPDIRRDGRLIVDMFGPRALINCIGVTVIWVWYAVRTQKKPSEASIDFYRRMRISGPGWKLLAGLYPDYPQIKSEVKNGFICWVSCIAFVFGSMIFLGKLIFHQWIGAAASAVILIIGGFVLHKTMPKLLRSGDEAEIDSRNT